MIARPLAAHSPRAVQALLSRFGWDNLRALAAGSAVQPVLVLVEQVPEATIQALVQLNPKLGIDLLTGEAWVLLAGTRSRLSVFARPWVLPPELVELGQQVGLALPGEPAESWHTSRGTIPLDHPVIMGILNLTPDSFSDGGVHATLEAALAQADRMIDQGATILDLGGESTRPGAAPVPAGEEIRRITPVLEALVQRHPRLFVSIDTVKSEVARAALDLGAAIVNDVSGLRLDSDIATQVRNAGAGLVLMHSRGDVSDMASTDHAEYGPDLGAAVLAQLHQSLSMATGAGVTPDAIVLDPGLGFSKTASQSLELLDQLSILSCLNRPILVGPSRKRFLGAATGRPLEDRDRATANACIMAYERGARIFRVHDVALTREALALAVAVRTASE